MERYSSIDMRMSSSLTAVLKNSLTISSRTDDYDGGVGHDSVWVKALSTGRDDMRPEKASIVSGGNVRRPFLKAYLLSAETTLGFSFGFSSSSSGGFCGFFAW